ncbi:MAG: YggS family pyridoxal phosphate-dependent enzyme [Actinomycetaceae bacterium]|nr:YggS family pyridoxal phosphate-dependent enzyme [Actinomycetaceae bacterium]MDU0970260.1 YggS family pyridoxal phosphate-dependent enzyme [Actinomycetaceae bacterium]
MSENDTIARRLERIRTQVDQARLQAGSDRVDLLIAVKQQTAATCVEVAHALHDADLPVMLGHNHVQEAKATTPAVRAAVPDARIHFIGHLQTNKINQALANVDLIETIDSARLADMIDQRVEMGRILTVFVQVNTSGEPSKSGIAPEAARELADHVAQCQSLRLGGLMTVGALSQDETIVRRSYARLATLRDQIAQDHPTCTELSMGMSGDFPWAIAEGATIVRIGQAVLGPRKEK